MAKHANQGQVPGQPPAVLAGSRVVLLVSQGPPLNPAPVFVGVPDVSSKSQGDALGMLQEAGLTSRVFDEPSDAVPHGHIMAQTPRPGQSAIRDAEIVLLVSSGPPAQPTGYVVLPNVTGESEADAVATIQSAGLTAQVVHDYSPNVPSGIVIDQIPNSASVAAPVKKSKVWLWILLAVVALALVGGAVFVWMNRTTAVPNVVGMSQQDAQTAIIAAGFRVGRVETTQTASAAEVGNVVAETPTPGTQAKVKSEVNVVVSGGQALVAVPNVTGMAQADAEAALAQAGLTAGISTANSSTVANGQVMTQAPTAGQQVPTGTSVGITVSQGPAGVAVPDLAGQTQSEAEAALKTAGLGTKVISNYDPDSPKGQVYAQAPAQGTIVAPGTVVSIHISKGPAPAPATVGVPNVIGQTQAKATTTLQDLGFVVSVSQLASGTAGQVVGQAPASGSQEPKGSTVSIVVSTGGP